MNRRKFLTAAAATGALAAAGCLDIIEDGVQAEAEPAKVPEETAANHDYEHEGLESHHINEEIEIGDQSRSIDVTTWTATYSKDASDLDLSDAEDFDDLEADAEDFLNQQGAGVGVVSTPSESIAGQEINPLARLDDDEIIEEFNAEVAEGEVRDVEHRDSHAATVLNEDIEVNEFDAVVETEDGDEFDIQLYVAEAHNEDDILLAVGAHPEMVDETETVIELVEGIDHPVDVPDDADNGRDGEEDTEEDDVDDE